MKRFILAAMMALSMATAAAQAQAQAQSPTTAQRPGVAPVHAPPAAAQQAAAPPTAAAPHRLDVNTAPADRLATLPGIGPARSKAIVDARPYEDLQDLVKKKAIGQALLDKLKDQLALADINASPAAALQKTLPGIGDVRAKAIVAARPFSTPADLLSKGVLTQPQLDRIKDLITY